MNNEISPQSLNSKETLRIKRRDLLKMVGGSGAFVATQGALNFWPTPAQAAAIATGRNLIIFTTDQQQELRWFPAGWEAANLPGLTRLRNKGVSFTRAYTNTAMCTPSRTTLFTGLYPAQHSSTDTLSEGMTQSEEEHQLDPTLPNIGTILQAHGYDVVWKGKWHLSKGIEHPDGTQTDDDITRYSISDWNSPDAGGDAKLKNYGGGTTDHDGRFFDGSTWQEPTGAPLNPDIFSQADGPKDAHYEAASAMAFLRNKIANPGGNPFCLIICLINPHDVLGCPGLSQNLGGNGTYIEGGYYGRDDGSSPWSEHTGTTDPIGLPPTFNENLDTNLKPPCHQASLQAYMGLGPVVTPGKKLMYLNFYGNLMKLSDRYLVKMLDLLDGVDGTVNATSAKALRDNSWVIFTSDHGDMSMAHGGLRQKSFMFYEEMANIPLIWSHLVDSPATPDFPAGSVCDELVSHVDFLTTLCEGIGIDTAPYNLRGVNYQSLLTNPTGPAVQNAILFTFDDIWSGQDASGFPNGIIAPPNRLRALVEKDYKYVYYFDGTGVASPVDEFYDLRSVAGGGTDTDAPTGKFKEYINYSEWAENQRGSALATTDIVNARTRMKADLNTAITTKLLPLAGKPAVDPEGLQLQFYEWVDANSVTQKEFQLTWMSRCTTQYQLQTSTDLQEWTNSGGLIAGTNGSLWINAPFVEKGFYRLIWSALGESIIPEPSIT